MAGAVKNQQPIKSEIEPVFEPVAYDEALEPSDGQGGELHARALQDRLLQTYGTATDARVQADEQSLSLRARLGIIAGAATALWLAIGAGIFALIG